MYRRARAGARVRDLFHWGSLADRRVAKYLLGHASAGHVQQDMRRLEEVVGGGMDI